MQADEIASSIRGVAMPAGEAGQVPAMLMGGACDKMVQWAKGPTQVEH